MMSCLYSSSQKVGVSLWKRAPGSLASALSSAATSCHQRSIMNTFSSCSASHRGSIDSKDDRLPRLAYSNHRKESLSPQCLALGLHLPLRQLEVDKRSIKVIQTTLHDMQWVSNWIYERICKRQDGESSHIRGTALVLQNGRSHELLQLLLTGLPKPVTGRGELTAPCGSAHQTTISSVQFLFNSRRTSPYILQASSFVSYTRPEAASSPAPHSAAKPQVGHWTEAEAAIESARNESAHRTSVKFSFQLLCINDLDILVSRERDGHIAQLSSPYLHTVCAIIQWRWKRP
jgi:hypothetical protein